MAFNFLDPIFDPLLKLGPFWAIFIVSIALSGIMTLIYYWMTDQKEMKELKLKTKELQKEIRANRNDPKKMMQINKKAMEVNTKYMMKSLRPTLVTFLPILLIFGWLSANLAYVPISVGTEFSVEATFKEANMQQISMMDPVDGIVILNGNNQTIIEGKASWNLKAEKEGDYSLIINYLGKQYMQKITVSSEPGAYENPDQIVKGSSLKKIHTSLDKVRPLGNFSIFGWKMNWLWLYIILSMVFSLGLRKVFKIY